MNQKAVEAVYTFIVNSIARLLSDYFGKVNDYTCELIEYGI